MKQNEAWLSDICSLVGCSFIGKDLIINNLNLCNRPSQFSSVLGYATSTKYINNIVTNKSVKALVVNNDVYLELEKVANINNIEYSYIISDNPEFLFYDIHNTLWLHSNFYNKYLDEPQIGKNCRIHQSVVIETGVIIGNNVEIGPNSVIRRGTIIDDNTYIGCCSIIGSEGFQAIRGYNKHIRHVGRTHIHHDVCIGDNTTIGNALFEGFTEIGAYTKIDNHTYIAHNFKCGNYCVITSSSVLLGSSVLQNNIWIAPNSVVLNGIKIEDNAFIGTLSYVNKDVSKDSLIMGIPAREK
ncbi:MAG: UDP-3-O-(3-hydroxymyristoyl) glucosamine N-acyltransferase [Bacteroidales bacterium]|nr:UDP-3-O-(3-hydroxymyristoyl) glucosamine N-acyltransferase [Bacteroidales bacterium]